MKWYRTKEADSLKHDVIAIFMRENSIIKKLYTQLNI